MLNHFLMLIFFLLVGNGQQLHSDDVKILLEVKKSFVDNDNVLEEWSEVNSAGFCAWRGVSCQLQQVIALNLSASSL